MAERRVQSGVATEARSCGHAGFSSCARRMHHDFPRGAPRVRVQSQEGFERAVTVFARLVEAQGAFLTQASGRDNIPLLRSADDN